MSLELVTPVCNYKIIRVAREAAAAAAAALIKM